MRDEAAPQGAQVRSLLGPVRARTSRDRGRAPRLSDNARPISRVARREPGPSVIYGAIGS